MSWFTDIRDTVETAAVGTVGYFAGPQAAAAASGFASKGSQNQTANILGGHGIATDHNYNIPDQPSLQSTGTPSSYDPNVLMAQNGPAQNKQATGATPIIIAAPTQNGGLNYQTILLSILIAGAVIYGVKKHG